MCQSGQPDVVWEEPDGPAEVGRQVVRYFEVGGLGSLRKGQEKSGRIGSGRAEHRGIRGRSAGKPVSDLESDVVGVLLSASGARGGGAQAARRRDPVARGAHCVGQNRSNGSSPQDRGTGRTGLPSRFLWLPPGAVSARRGRGVPATLLEV